ncbi:MAG TPA: FAD-binding oxidoreductase [Gammaproteobacteria bacterium]|nr:FAD-binding oxidoreductase [Gammaproteobacteria bacterium]
MTTPPGVSERDFLRAVDRFKSVVGAAWVFTSDDDVALYRDAYSPLFGEEEEKVTSAAVAPDSAEQVVALVRIANELRIPLYPISTGRNLGYGGAAPVLSGSVVLDLKRMNRILEVDERNAYALVEPGVSYFDLYRHIKERKLKLWIDCPDPGWGSVVGNSLDHGVGYTMNPYRDHHGAQCGMEVVTGAGELVRTGMGALPGSKTWQHFKYGFGPHVDGMFSQSNFGVVTKMGIWLMPEPEAYIEGQALVFRHDDIIPLVEHMKYFMNTGLQNCGTNLQSPIRFQVSANPELRPLLTRSDPESIARLDAFAAERKTPFYSNWFKFYGPEEVVRAQWAYAKKRMSDIPGAQFVDGPFYKFPLTDEQIPRLRDEQDFGIPTLSTFSIGARSQFGPATKGHVGFSPVIPMTGEAVIESQRVFETILQEYAREAGRDVALNVFPQSYHPRTFVILIMFNVMPDPAVNRRTREVFKRLVQVAAEHGWGEYRTHTAFMDDCASAYAFNDHSLRRLHESIKDAVDPNGILSAGRYGIWPKHLRKA